MLKGTIVVLAGALLLAALAFRARRSSPRVSDAPPAVAAMTAHEQTTSPTASREARHVNLIDAASALSAEEKAARVAKIKRDYDEIRAKASAEYSAAGAAFPGGLNAFLRQLALLEREKRADLAAVLAPRELEDLELRETTAGQLVQRLLGDTATTEEQRRAVFRLQREFEDRFALTFDLTPQALLERERARQQVQEQIRATLGDTLFPAWLRGEGAEFEQMAAFAAERGLPPATALDLWRVKNDFTLRRLEAAAASETTSGQQLADQALLVQETEARLLSLVGAAGLEAGRASVFGWLPKR